jgi:hypothetical protein
MRRKWVGARASREQISPHVNSEHNGLLLIFVGGAHIQPAVGNNGFSACANRFNHNAMNKRQRFLKGDFQNLKLYW